MSSKAGEFTVTAPDPKVPVAPPLPTLRVPALTVVAPAYELLPVRIWVPVPVLVKKPPLVLPPEKVPEKVAVNLPTMVTLGV